MIGGIPRNLGQGARFNDSKHFVIEGDEYDTAFFDKRSKFVHYLPELLIVNNIEFDHADIFDDLEEIKTSFRHLLRIVPQNGMVLFNGDDANCVEVAKEAFAPIVEIGFSENCAQRIRDVTYSADGSRFRLGDDVFEVPLIGEFNVRNAAMAITAARFYGASLEKIRARARELRRHRAPAGSARRSARREGDRRLRPSPDRDQPDADRAAPSLSGAPAVGDFRAALEHDAARGFAGAAARRAQTGRRRFHCRSRAAGADPGGRAARSGSGRARRSRKAGVRRFTRRMPRTSSSGWCRCCRRTMSWSSSATAASTASTRRFWRGCAPELGRVGFGDALTTRRHSKHPRRHRSLLCRAHI